MLVRLIRILRDLPRILMLLLVALDGLTRYAVARVILRRPVPPGRALSRSLQKAGVAYVKLGQVMARRIDLFDETFCTDLDDLFWRTAPLPPKVVERVIRQELGGGSGERFARFSSAPFASGGLGQAHDACLSDETQVVVKVQRPGIAATLERELRLMRAVASFIDLLRPLARVRAVELVAELEESMRLELDYSNDLRLALVLRRAAQRMPGIVVPQPILALSSRRVLTKEAVVGRPLGAAAHREKPPALAAGITAASELARSPPDEVTLVRAAHAVHALVLATLLDHGLFDERPHAGGLQLLHDGRVAIVDWNASGFLGGTARDALARVLDAIARQSVDEAVASLTELLGGQVDFSDPRTESALRRGLVLHFAACGAGGAPGRRGAGELLLKLALELPGTSERVLLGALRSLASTERLLEHLVPSFDALDSLRAWLEIFRVRRGAPEALVARVGDVALQYARLAELLPASVRGLEAAWRRTNRSTRGAGDIAGRLLRFIAEISGAGLVLVGLLPARLLRGYTLPVPGPLLVIAGLLVIVTTWVVSRREREPARLEPTARNDRRA